jgi:hypothetical protein
LLGNAGGGRAGAAALAARGREWWAG